MFDLRTIRLTSGVSVEVATGGHRGPAIVFLHGYTDSWRSFESILERLPENVRAVAFSQRGHGGSERPPSGYNIPQMATDAAALMEAMAISGAMVVGHSMGSLVAQELALTRPDLVSRLVLVGSAGCFDNAGVRELAGAVHELPDPVPFPFAWEFQASTVHRPVPKAFLDAATNESVRVPARIWRDALDGILAFDSRARLSRLTMPTLILWGNRDQIASRGEQLLLHRGIKDSTFVCYEDTGHAPHWEQPQRFTDEILGFMSFVSAQPDAPIGP